MAGINVLLQALICRIDCFDQPVLTCNLQKLLAVSSLTVACLYHSCFWCFLLLLKNYEKNKNWGHNEMYPFIHLISFVVVSIWSAILNNWNVPKRSWHRFFTEIILDSWTSFLSFTYFGMTGGGISYCDAFTCMAMHNILGFHTDEFSCMVFFIYIYSVCPVLFILEKSSSLSVSEYPFLFVVFDLSSMTLQWERVWLCNVARNDRELERL